MLFVHLPVARRGLLPFVIASQTVPIIAIAPMIVVGLGQLGAPPWVPKSAIAAYLTFFPVTINVLRGLESVDRDALALMKSYAATHLQIFTKLRLPNSTPYLFTALKIASTASVIGAIIGELPDGLQTRHRRPDHQRRPDQHLQPRFPLGHDRHGLHARPALLRRRRPGRKANRQMEMMRWKSRTAF